MTYLDTLVSERPDDGGFGFIAYKPAPHPIRNPRA